MPSDSRRTVRIALIQDHYASLGDELKWTVDRYRKLCCALQLTEYELAAMLRCHICDVDRWYKSRRFPHPIELHLTLIERAFYPCGTKKPIFPCVT